MFTIYPDLEYMVTKISLKAKADENEITGNQNCLLCTWCLETALRNICILPRPVYSPRDIIFSVNPLLLFSNPLKITSQSKQELLTRILKYPDSRYYCHTKWENGNGGHEFLLLNINGEVLVADAQQGIIQNANLSDYLNNANYQQSYTARIDNKPLNLTALDLNNPKYITEWDNHQDTLYLLKQGMLNANDIENALEKRWITKRDVARVTEHRL